VIEARRLFVAACDRSRDAVVFGFFCTSEFLINKLEIKLECNRRGACRRGVICLFAVFFFPAVIFDRLV
jgi:hypothetical protein